MLPDMDLDPNLGMDICPKNGHSANLDPVGTVSVQYNVAIGSGVEI